MWSVSASRVKLGYQNDDECVMQVVPETVIPAACDDDATVLTSTFENIASPSPIQQQPPTRPSPSHTPRTKHPPLPPMRVGLMTLNPGHHNRIMDENGVPLPAFLYALSTVKHPAVVSLDDLSLTHSDQKWKTFLHELSKIGWDCPRLCGPEGVALLHSSTLANVVQWNAFHSMYVSTSRGFGSVLRKDTVRP